MIGVCVWPSTTCRKFCQVITISDNTLRTGPDGSYSLDQFHDSVQVSFDVTHPEYYKRRRLISLIALETKRDSVLVATRR